MEMIAMLGGLELHRKTGFWVLVGLGLTAWFLRPKAADLAGWSRQNPSYDFTAGEQKAAGMSHNALWGAIADLRLSLLGARLLDREDKGDREGWYSDELSVYLTEAKRRSETRCGT